MSFHHVALSVSDLEASMRFYQGFGFEEAFTWRADDKTLRIVHLRLGDVVLELFHYSQPYNDPATREKVGGNLTTVGVKHMALRVPNIEEAHRELSDRGLRPETEPQNGRTRLRYFFVRDPDGVWVEIVEDNRF